MMDDKKNIENQKSGFKVPKAYFDTLEDSILDHQKSESITDKSGFKTPDDYFSDFEMKTPSENHSSKVIKLQDWGKWVAAASIVAFTVIGALYIDQISSTQNIQFSDLDNDMIERYLDDNIESPEEFIDYENTSLDNIINKNLTTLDDEDIIEYLNDKIEDQEFEDE